MEKEIYVVVKNKNTERCVGLLKVRNTCYFDDYRTNEWDVELGDSKEEVEQTIVDYLVKDLPCNPQDIQFMIANDFYDYFEKRVTKIAKKFCGTFNIGLNSGCYVEGGVAYVEVKIAKNIIALEGDVEEMMTYKDNEELYQEIKDMFVDAVDWFKNNNCLDELVHVDKVMAKRNKVFNETLE